MAGGQPSPVNSQSFPLIDQSKQSTTASHQQAKPSVHSMPGSQSPPLNSHSSYLIDHSKQSTRTSHQPAKPPTHLRPGSQPSPVNGKISLLIDQGKKRTVSLHQPEHHTTTLKEMNSPCMQSLTKSTSASLVDQSNSEAISSYEPVKHLIPSMPGSLPYPINGQSSVLIDQSKQSIQTSHQETTPVNNLNEKKQRKRAKASSHTPSQPFVKLNKKKKIHQPTQAVIDLSNMDCNLFDQTTSESPSSPEYD